MEYIAYVLLAAIFGLGFWFIASALLRKAEGEREDEEPVTEGVTSTVVRTSRVSEHRAHDGGHAPKHDILGVLLAIFVIGELCLTIAIGGPAFVRAINAPYDFKAHNTILPQSAFASKQAVVTCDPGRSNPVSVPSIGTWSDEIHVPRGCIPYTNPVIDGVVVEAQCREVSTSGWEQCLGTYVSIRIRSVRDVDVWMEQYKG